MEFLFLIAIVFLWFGAKAAFAAFGFGRLWSWQERFLTKHAKRHGSAYVRKRKAQLAPHYPRFRRNLAIAAAIAAVLMLLALATSPPSQ